MSVGTGLRATQRWSATPDDSGSAVLEFVLLAVVLVVPFVYAVVAVLSVEQAAFAVTAATREAGRAYVTAPTGATAPRRAAATADVVLADHGLDHAAVEISCETAPCLTPGSRVSFAMTLAVPIPLVPHLRGRAPAVIRVRANHVEVVDTYRERRS